MLLSLKRGDTMVNLTPEQIETIKSAFKKFDITEGLAPTPKSDMTPEKVDFSNRVGRIFKQYWTDNLKDLGVAKSMKNYSSNHPVNLLMNTDSSIVEEFLLDYSDLFDKNTDYSQININEVFNMLADDNKSDIPNIFTLCKKRIDKGLNEYAQGTGKDVSELSNEEIWAVFDKVFSNLSANEINILMIGQQVPALAELSKQTQTVEDFNNNVKENHPKTDFLRKQYGLRRKFDSLLSFEELAEDDLITEPEFEQITDEVIDKAVANFVDTLDDVERTIYFMKQDGYTQEGVAHALGYKTHSAVTKRLAKMKEKAIKYCENIDF